MRGTGVRFAIVNYEARQDIWVDFLGLIDGKDMFFHNIFEGVGTRTCLLRGGRRTGDS